MFVKPSVFRVSMSYLKQKLAEWEARGKIADDKTTVAADDYKQNSNFVNNSVTKSNVLARAYYRFNIVEKRIMEALISQVNPQNNNINQLQKLELNAIDYARIYNVHKKVAYRDLEKGVCGLMHRVFSVEISGGREEFTLMSNAQYLEGKGKITCSFNMYITPHLIGLKGKFTKYPLNSTANFKSSYTWRIYELLVSWAQDPKLTDGLFAGWCSISVDELRDMLGVPKTYQWVNFQKQVLLVAKTELLEKVNIELDIEAIKTSRKITHLKFIFSTLPT